MNTERRIPRWPGQLALFLVFLLLSPEAPAQHGAWIGHPPAVPVNGIWQSDAGTDAVGCVPQTSRYIYFFDINSSAWTEVDLGSEESFTKLEATGHTVIAYSGRLLVGYSAITSQWDTVTYAGTPLSPNGVDIYRSWGAGANLAYFLTDVMMYIFDAELGSWQELAYTLPPGYYGVGFYWTEEDYAGAILVQPPPARNKVLAYSLYTHSFNHLEEGGSYIHTHSGMTHGFVTQWSNGLHSSLHGYSSFNNTFTEVVIDGAYVSGGNERGSHADFTESTVAAYNYTVIINPSTYQVHLLGYDTRRGEWTTSSHEYDPAEWSTVYGFINGGQFAVAYQTNENTQEVVMKVYDGQSGDIHTITPGLTGMSGLACGGTVFAAADLHNVYFFTIEGEHSALLDRRWETSSWYVPGDNFALYGTYDMSVSDSLECHIYNGTTDNATHVITWRGTQIFLNPAMIVLPMGGPSNVVYFYSSEMDALSAESFPADAYVGVYMSSRLAFIPTATQTSLFDAATGTVHTVPYLLSGNVGDSSILLERGSREMEAYSGVTRNWPHFTITEDVLNCHSYDMVGLASARDASWTDIFYAYNGFFDNLVFLDPVGVQQVYGQDVGGQTILIVRDSMLYAFDPFAATGSTVSLLFRESGIGLPILDLSATEHDIFVPGPLDVPPLFSLSGVDVLIDTVHHTSTGDLTLTLTHNGLTDTLVVRAGGEGDDFLMTQLSDAALNPIVQGTPPFTGRFLSEDPLSLFAGTDATGAWTLRIYDGAAGNTGSLNAWGLKLYFDETTSMTPRTEGTPYEFRLYQNYPNPCNPETEIRYGIPETRYVTLKIFDLLGREVAVLVDETQHPGRYNVKWDASGNASGVYFYRLTARPLVNALSGGQAGDFMETRKMMVIR